MKNFILFICLICFSLNIFAKPNDCKYESNKSTGEKRENAIRGYQAKVCDILDNPDIRLYCYTLKEKNINNCKHLKDKLLVKNCIEDVKLLKGE